MLSFGLNIIVGPGEANLLKRCLDTFDAKARFDEIVIVNTSLDQQVNETALRYTDKVFYFPWESERYPYGNFGGARECARKNSTADKILWLDADDVLLDQYKESWIRTVDLIKNEDHAHVMIWRMPYAIIVDENGTPVTWFRRERIFDRERISWRRPVHELMFPEWEMVSHADINGMFITHLPMKPTFTSAVRNVAILEHEYALEPEDTQTRYFLGRDYMYVGKSEKGIALLEGIVSEMSTSYEMLYAIAMELIWFYGYGSSNPRPMLDLFKKDNLLKVESWCRLALAFTLEYAEPYVLLGDVYWHRGEIDAAMRMYLTALKKGKNAGRFKAAPLYDEVPSDRLSRVFEARGMLGMALHYSQRAYSQNPLLDYREHQKYLIKCINEEAGHELGKD